MKCNNCGSEWNVSSGVSVSITNCPFCGKPLHQEKKKLDTIEEVLVEINSRFGMSVLTDKAKLVAYFSDLAPHLSKQRRILNDFFECDGAQKIINIMNFTEKEQVACINQIVKEMKDELYVEEAASRIVCEAFLFAISGKHIAGSVIDDRIKTDNKPENATCERERLKREKEKDAFEWLLHRAEQGYSKAQADVGAFYEHGVGVEKNLTEAYNWYKKSADQGDELGKKYLQELCEKMGINEVADVQVKASGDNEKLLHKRKFLKVVNEQTVKELVAKHGLKNIYLTSDNQKFPKKVSNAINAYANISEDEKALIVVDYTLLGNGSQGFLITDRKLYCSVWSGDYRSKRIKIQIELNNIRSLKIDWADSSRYLFLCYYDQLNNKKDWINLGFSFSAEREEKFWKELLNIK